MSILIIIGAIAVGLVTGTVTSLIGASGVSIVVPALTLFFAVNSHFAIGTSLLVNVITSLVVAISYFRQATFACKRVFGLPFVQLFELR